MPEFEHDIKVLPIDPNFPQAVENLAKEGWQLIPDVLPVAIYHVIRPKIAAGDVQLKLAIDDSKINVIRNGKIIG